MPIHVGTSEKKAEIARDVVVAYLSHVKDEELADLSKVEGVRLRQPRNSIGKPHIPQPIRNRHGWGIRSPRMGGALSAARSEPGIYLLAPDAGAQPGMRVK